MRHWQLGLKAILLAGAATSCLSSQHAVAQTSQQVAANGSGGDQIEEVIVTARKREENVQKVPISVSVQSGESLQQHQVTDLYALQRVVPGLGVGSNVQAVGEPTFAIRGIQAILNYPQVESSVGLVVDDVPIGRSELADLEFYDLDRIEVLKGPQGMLFGKNAAAGLINIVTANPELDRTDFMTHVQYGNMNTSTAGNRYKLDVMGNVPISDDAALRLDAFFTHDDGLVKNVIQPNKNLGNSTFGGRVKFLWEPISRLTVLISGDFADENGPAEAVDTMSAVNTNPHPDLTAILFSGLGITPSRRNDLAAFDGSAGYHYDLYGTSLKADYDLGGGYTITDVTAYRGRKGHDTTDLDNTPLNTLSDNTGNDDTWQFSDELRIASPADQRFTYQAGIYYLHVTSSNYDTIGGNFAPEFPAAFAFPPLSAFAPFPALPPGYLYVHEVNIQDFRGHSEAGFFEGQYKLMDDLHLTAGARYTIDDQTYKFQEFALPNSYFPNVFPLNLEPPVNNTGSERKHNISWRAQLSYDVSDEVMTYVSYARGYKGPTFDNFFATPVESEIPTNWEIGLKSTWLDHRLRLNAALFHTVFQGFQTDVQELVPGTGTGPIPATFVSTVTSTGHLYDKGAELEATAIPFDGLTLDGAVTYLDTEYQGAQALSCLPGTPAIYPPAVLTASNQCFIPSGVGGPFSSGDELVNGNPLAFAPKWEETLSARYEHPVWSGWTGFIQGDGWFRSSYSTTPQQSSFTRVGSTAIFGLSLGSQSDDGHWVGTLFVRNLTDVRIPTYLFYNPGGNVNGGNNITGGDWVQQFSPDSFRTIGVSLDYHM